MDIATAENRGHRGERLTRRSDFIDPLRCHIEICKNIYMTSHSPFRPSNEEIAAKYKDIHIKLLKEYMKKGDLEAAKETRKAINDIGGSPYGVTDSLYRLLTYLPFNVVNPLVRFKRGIMSRSYQFF